MEKKNGNFLAIAIMFFLFMMISFVTGLQNPFGVIVKQQFSATNLMSQLGNAANFIAYAFMGLPAGLILSKKGYKFTALSAVAVGLVGRPVGCGSRSGGRDHHLPFREGRQLRRVPAGRLRVRFLDVHAQHGGKPDAEYPGWRRKQR